MEEMSTTIAVPFRVGNSVCDKPTITTHMDVSRMKLMTDTGLLSNSITKVSTDTFIGDEDHDGDCLREEVGIAAVKPQEQGREEEIPMVSQNVNSLIVGDEVLTTEIEDDDLILLEGDTIVDSSLSVANENSSFCREEFISSEVSTDLGTRSSIDIEKSIATVNIAARVTDLGVSNEVTDEAVSLEEETGVRSGPILLQVFFINQLWKDLLVE